MFHDQIVVPIFIFSFSVIEAQIDSPEAPASPDPIIPRPGCSRSPSWSPGTGWLPPLGSPPGLRVRGYRQAPGSPLAVRSPQTSRSPEYPVPESPARGSHRQRSPTPPPSSPGAEIVGISRNALTLTPTAGSDVEERQVRLKFKLIFLPSIKTL